MEEAATSNNDRDDPLSRQLKVVEGLIRLSVSLKELNDKESAPVLSHYRSMPEAVAQSYEILHQGAQLIHGTSTKYSLLGKLDALEQAKLTDDLWRGCQLLMTAALVVHDDQTGCARSTRHHCKQAVRSIVHTVLQLIQAWTEGDEAVGENSTLGAQKTGAVWEMCDVVLERKLPRGNRNAMRRDLLTFMMECTETTREFQEMIDAGPSLKEAEVNGVAASDDWDDLMEDQYTTNELPVATACLFLVKCSRGCLNASIQVIESVGNQLQNADGDAEASTTILQRISLMHDLARNVGEGMTDLGASMYSPLQLTALEAQVERQANAIQETLDFVTDEMATNEFAQEVNDLISRVRDALSKRRREARDALRAAGNT